MGFWETALNPKNPRFAKYCPLVITYLSGLHVFILVAFICRYIGFNESIIPICHAEHGSITLLGITMEPTPGQIIARVAAGSALTMSAGHGASALDRFATWFLAAFGTGFAIIISQIDSVSDIIPRSAIASSAYLFLWATIFCVCQRYVTAVIESGAAAAREGRELGEKAEHMDLAEFLTQMKLGMPAIIRPMCASLFRSVETGDFAAGGRMFIRLCLWQGALVSIQIVFLLAALTELISEIKA